jgi:hypothetical protein
MGKSLNRKHGIINQSYRRFFFYFLTTFVIALVLIIPTTQNALLALEFATYFAIIITLSIIGCSIEYRHRSLFMSHYHGTRTIVMDELTQEMSEEKIDVKCDH